MTKLYLSVAISIAVPWCVLAQSNAPPTSATRLLQEASQLQNAGKFAEACGKWQQFLRDFPGDPAESIVHQGLGACLLEMKDWQGSIDAFKKALKLLPKGEPPAAIQWNLAVALYRRAEQTKTEYHHKEVEQALQDVSADQNMSKERRALAGIYLARLAEEDKDWSKATRLYRAFLHDFPDHSSVDEARLGLADALLHGGQYQDAETAFGELANRRELAALDYVHFRWAEVAELRGELIVAADRWIAWLDKFAKSSLRERALPRASQAQLQAARQLTEKEQYEVAWERGRWVLETKIPDAQPTALYLTGFCAMKLRKFDDAISYYQRLSDEYPKSEQAPVAAYSLGVAFESQGANAKALTAYQSFLKRYPEHSLAGEARKRVQVLQ
jgi:TolA-binding protein